MAIHPVNHHQGEYTTLENHMPPEHKAQQTWSRERFERWGSTIGKEVQQVITQWFESKSHPEQAYRSCLGLQKLARKHEKTKLNLMCDVALSMGLVSLKTIASLLKNKPSTVGNLSTPESIIEPHANIRGMDYYT